MFEKWDELEDGNGLKPVVQGPGVDKGFQPLGDGNGLKPVVQWVEVDKRFQPLAATGAEIDRLVYELYGLTAEEVRIVEEATSEKIKSKG